MNFNKIIEVQVEIIVNRSLYENHFIDELTFSKVNDKLLKRLKGLKRSYEI